MMRVCLRTSISVTVAGVVGLLILLAPASPVFGAGRQQLSGSVPSIIKGAGLAPVGKLPGTDRLHLVIELPVRNSDALGELAKEVSDPSSPNFRHYLTPAQVTEKFGPTDQDYQALVDFARANDLTVTRVYPNRITLDVEGSVAAIEKAFQVTLRTYQHPTENRTFFAPDTEPSLDVSVPVAGVSGLNNYVLPHPMLHKSPLAGPGTKKQNGSGPWGTYMGYDFRNAYVPGTPLTGIGQSVGVLEFDSGFFQSDITTYENMAGLPDIPVIPILLDGYGGGPGWANDEVSLDIEMAISMAPGLDQVLVYEGDQTNSILNAMVSDVSVKQFGASWSYDVDATSLALWLVMQVQGQSFYNASGDSDAYVLIIPSPCDNPELMIVGGTTLSMSGNGQAYASETVWNWGGGIGSSGGISPTHLMPWYQQGVDMSQNQGSSTRRDIPDIAMVGDNIFVEYSDGGQGDFGGTSCSTPLWAAFTALVNQGAAAQQFSAVGFINPVLYDIGVSPSDDCYYRDTTTGNNTWQESPTKFYAFTGYDLGTGWGSPSVPLIDALLGHFDNNHCWDQNSGVSENAGAAAAPLVRPNPTTGACSVAFNSPVAGPVTVAIVDVNGRVVRHLLSGVQPAGRLTLSWDGRNDAGKDLPGGIYLTRVQTAKGVTLGKVVISR